jgi:hypothetical protein
MSAPNRKQVRERIIAIAEASGLVTTTLNGPECRLTPEQLPALYVVPRTAPTRQYTNGQRRIVTCEYELLYLVTQICTDDEQEQFDALEDVWEVIDALPDYFAANARRLMLRGTDSGLTGVADVGHMRDGGAQYTSWGEDTYACAMYTLPVDTQRA